MKTLIYAFLSISSLLVCMIVPFLYLSAKIGEGQFKWTFLAASVTWFIFASLWNGAKKKRLNQGNA